MEEPDGENLIGGVDQDIVDEHGGTEAFARDMVATGCCCEPCSLCEEDKPHEVPHDCRDYRCLGCDAKEYLSDLEDYRRSIGLCSTESKKTLLDMMTEQWRNDG